MHIKCIQQTAAQRETAKSLFIDFLDSVLGVLNYLAVGIAFCCRGCLARVGEGKRESERVCEGGWRMMENTQILNNYDNGLGMEIESYRIA